MKQKITLLTFALITLNSFATEKSPLTLKSVMQGLEKSMNGLNRGIFYEDYKLINKAASKVANHPKPKSQLPTLIKTLNIRLLKFKSIDSKVHDSAIDIVTLTKKKDMTGILNKHRIIMNNCVACHTQFRNEILEALSGK